MRRLVQVRRVENDHIESILRSPVQVNSASYKLKTPIFYLRNCAFNLSDVGPDQLRRDPCGTLSSQPDPRQDGGLEVTIIVVRLKNCLSYSLFLLVFLVSLLKIFFQAPLHCDHL